MTRRRNLLRALGADHPSVKICGVQDVDMTPDELISALRWAVGATRGPMDDEVESADDELAFEAKTEDCRARDTFLRPAEGDEDQRQTAAEQRYLNSQRI